MFNYIYTPLFVNMLMVLNLQLHYNFKEFSIYKHNQSQSLTSNSVKNVFKQLKTSKCDSLLIEESQNNEINEIINRARVSKIILTKIGNDFLFCIAKKDLKSQELLIYKEGYLISNYTEKKQYWIENTEDQIWLKKFAKNYLYN